MICVLKSLGAEDPSYINKEDGAALTVIRQDVVRSVAACGVHVAAGRSVSVAFQSRTLAYKS